MRNETPNHALQMRIAKAEKEGKRGQVKALQHLLAHSFFAKYGPTRCQPTTRLIASRWAGETLPRSPLPAGSMRGPHEAEGGSRVYAMASRQLDSTPRRNGAKA